MTAATVPPEYRCTVCGAGWSYRAVRHVARCRDCGAGLVRAEAGARPASAAPSAPPPARAAA